MEMVIYVSLKMVHLLSFVCAYKRIMYVCNECESFSRSTLVFLEVILCLSCDCHKWSHFLLSSPLKYHHHHLWSSFFVIVEQKEAFKVRLESWVNLFGFQNMHIKHNGERTVHSSLSLITSHSIYAGMYFILILLHYNGLIILIHIKLKLPAPRKSQFLYCVKC